MSEEKLLELMAKSNTRGMTIGDMVCAIQANQERIEESPYYRLRIAYLLGEIERRFSMKDSGIIETNRAVVSACKEKIRIEDVIEWYCEVSFFKNLWSFKCNKHGPDKHPSGKIYLDQNSWWCFGCNKGGDIFNAVMHYENIDFLEALRKLAANIGLNLKQSESNKRYSTYDDSL